MRQEDPPWLPVKAVWASFRLWADFRLWLEWGLADLTDTTLLPYTLHALRWICSSYRVESPPTAIAHIEPHSPLCHLCWFLFLISHCPHSVPIFNLLRYLASIDIVQGSTPFIGSTAFLHGWNGYVERILILGNVCAWTLRHHAAHSLPFCIVQLSKYWAVDKILCYFAILCIYFIGKDDESPYIWKGRKYVWRERTLFLWDLEAWWKQTK